MTYLKWTLLVLIMSVLTACGSQKPVQHRWSEGSDTQKTPQHQTTNPSTDPSKDKTQIVQPLAAKNYMKSLPGQIPTTSKTYTMTIKLPKNYQGWNQVVLFNQASNSQQPYRIINGESQGVERTFRGIPSASQAHMDIFGIGDKSNTNMNEPLELYTNDTLHSQGHVYFVMGHAMLSDHFVEDTNATKLPRGKENGNIAGYWFKLQTGKWYRLMEVDENMKAHLRFQFKLEASPSTSNQDDTSGSNDGLPGALPDQSSNVSLTLDVSKAPHSQYITTSQLAVYSSGDQNQSPNSIIDPVKTNGQLTFLPIPTVSKETMGFLVFGNKKDSYQSNVAYSIYTNSTLNQKHLVDIAAGQAMGSSFFFVTDAQGHKLKVGKNYGEVTGSWFQVKPGKWYRMMVTDPNGKTTLAFQFKIEMSN